MRNDEFEVEIDANGIVTVRTIGIKGARCLDVAEFISRIVGREESRVLTSEYYEAGTELRLDVDIRNAR